MNAAELPVRVLVVDDSSMMRALIRRALQGRPGWSAEVIEAVDGLEALELIRNSKLEIDVVLLDWNMPRLDGIGFLKSLKASRAPGEVAVIMVTTQSQRSSVAEALRWGASEYLLKPFKEEALREKVERLSRRTAPAPSDTAVLLRRAAGDGAGDVPFLQMIPAEAAQELILRGRSRSAPPGALLSSAGRRSDVLGIVLRGQVELLDPRSSLARDVRGAGDCWGDETFLQQVPASFDVRSRTPLEYVEVGREQLAELVRIHPALASCLAAVVARKNRKPPAAESPAGLAGRLDVVPISDLIQVLHLCRKTGHLRLRGPGREGGLFFSEGELRHAWLEEVEGEDALYALLDWNDATFAFESGAAPDVATLTQPTMMLVMESARRIDERRRGEAARPDTA